MIFQRLDYQNLAGFLNSHGRYREARVACRMGLQLQPTEAALYAELARAALGLECEDEAMTACERALTLDPTCASAHIVRAYAYEALGSHEKALACARNAIACDPEAEEAHCALASLLLWHGDLANGLPEQEWHWRREAESLAERFGPRPAWSGRPCPQLRLLVAHEQGAGDLLHLARYFPRLRALVDHLILECTPDMIDLMRSVAGVDEVVAKPGPLDGRFDAYVRLMSLPLILGTTLDTLPNDVPYLRADPSASAAWRRRLGDERFTIGIAWAGNPAHTNDRERSVDLSLFAALGDLPGVRWISLQKGPRAVDPAPPGLELMRCATALHTWADTAALVDTLDLVISVDTSIAHLAGALGKAVWLLLPRWPDWRWMLERDDTPWYPTMRLFRRKRGEGWASVFARVADELRVLVR